MEQLQAIINEAIHYTDNELKQYALQHNLDRIYSKARSTYNLANSLGAFPEHLTAEQCQERYLNFLTFQQSPTLQKVCENLNHSKYARTSRMKKKIETMLTLGECSFVTLTFAPVILENTTEETRRQYVRKYLKEQSPCYLANIDYGKKNEREHYHAVVFGRVDLLPWRKKCGRINAKPVRYFEERQDNDSPVKLAKYITKLTNHAFKETAEQQRIIYSSNYSQFVLQAKKDKVKRTTASMTTAEDLFGNVAIELSKHQGPQELPY